MFQEKVKVKTILTFRFLFFQNIYLERELVQYVHDPYLIFLV